MNLKNKYKEYFNLKTFFFLIAFMLLSITAVSSILYIYEKRHQISQKIKTELKFEDKYSIKEDKKKLAKDILNGGYILLFRHAEREKWIDVQMYDAIEVNKNLKAEDSYFINAVCLSSRGLVQARMMGEIIKDLKVPIHRVITSPSCRARQTAELAFGGYDEIKNIFLHKGPFNQKSKEFQMKVKKQLLSYVPPKNSNIIISAHNSVIFNDIFDEREKDIIDILEESGFYVIKNINNKLILIDKFHSFHKFNVFFQTRPAD